ncbi:hypothetical protein KIN20_034522 [Parelaphostrongylus tenuis]|uniref:DUF1758 domain-containing protein n=1 Tax=Parelaphostrongylus tenuis TaxID=148309 RepID=A0AAD5RAH7_PARTN|nr:hypothetical protein KIN20_034522 [Parelaphostrongylus tenuis]
MTSEQALMREALALNRETKIKERIDVMLDTGSDRSFTPKKKLAQRLRLHAIDSIDLNIPTFGDLKEIKQPCEITILHLIDIYGPKHGIVVTIVKSCTKLLKCIPLSEGNKSFLDRNNIRLSINPLADNIHREVLLGCSDVFSLLQIQSVSTYASPSGLKLIPSKLGYLVVGANHNRCMIAHNSTVLVAHTHHTVYSNSHRRTVMERFLYP